MTDQPADNTKPPRQFDYAPVDKAVVLRRRDILRSLDEAEEARMRHDRLANAAHDAAASYVLELAALNAHLGLPAADRSDR